MRDEANNLPNKPFLNLILRFCYAQTFDVIHLKNNDTKYPKAKFKQDKEFSYHPLTTYAFEHTKENQFWLDRLNEHFF